MEEHTLSVLQFDALRRFLAAFALTEVGKRACLALRPAQSREEASEALAQTAQLARFREENSRLPLGSFSDVSGALERSETFHRPLEPEELSAVAALIKNARSLQETLLSLPEDGFGALRARASGLRLPVELAERIEGAVDPRGRIHDWASERLRYERERAAELRELIRSRVQALVKRSSTAKLLQEERWTIRNDRFVLAVKREHRDRIPGVLHGYSQSGSTAYVEPQEVVVQGNELQAALEAVRREETRILLELTKEVLARRRELIEAQAFLGWADLTYAKTEWIRLYKFTVPEIAKDGVLHLHRARHPLLLWYEAGERLKNPDLESLWRRVVPLDLELGRDFRILVVTGPNTGGKTVALKTIGLAAVMTACGLPVPAAGPTRVPFYREIFVDVGDEQSLEQSLSTFSSHMRHVVRIVREARGADLVLLDELGSGTDPLEGAALGTVILEELARRGCHAVVSTHLGTLKQYAYTHNGAANAAMTFDPATLAPTYRMVIGAPGRSCALLVAERLGLPRELVEAARSMLKAPEPQEVLMERMEKARRAVEAERRRAQKLRRRVERLKDRLGRQLAETRKSKEVLVREAEDEIERKVREVRDAIKEILPKLKSVPQGLRPYVEKLEELADTILTVTPLGRRREAFARSLKEHAEVYVPRLGAVCTVVKVNKSKRRLTVRTGGLEAEVGFDDISWVPPPGGGNQ